MYDILPRQLFFVAAVVYSGSWDFLYGRCIKQCLSGYVLHHSLLHLLLKNCDFLNTDISQGSVVTRLGCCGVFKYDFVTNFLLSLTVKEF